MTFMIEGGAPMWLTLALFLGAAAWTVWRRASDGWRASLVGAHVCIASGLAGFATGIYATVDGFRRFGEGHDPAVLAQGIRESAHNLLFAGALAALLALLGIALARHVRSTVRPA